MSRSYHDPRRWIVGKQVIKRLIIFKENKTMSFFTFQRVAKGYANHRPYFHPLVMNRVRQRLNLKDKCENALDVGCGTGLSTIALKELVNNVTGIDGSEEMIAVANAYRDEQIIYHHAP